MPPAEEEKCDGAAVGMFFSLGLLLRFCLLSCSTPQSQSRCLSLRLYCCPSCLLVFLVVRAAGITPEQFWGSHERLVGLARGGGERGAFERAIEEMITRNSKKAVEAASATVPKTSANGGGAGSANLGGDGGDGSAGAGGAGGIGHGGDEEEAWEPGGPELHAVLGATGDETLG